MIRFQKKYLFFAILIFIIEVLIALFVHDKIIRPYIGDTLVVILIYCFVKAFLDIPVLPAALGVLAFSYIIEILQYFHFINWLGLNHSKVARIVLGNSFAWIDILAYTVGIAAVFFIEKIKNKR